MLIIGTAGNDTFVGSAQNDFITGLGGDDKLAGGAGDDLLVGGAGADTLSGGTGSDTASYYDATTGVDAFLMAPSFNHSDDSAGDVYVSIENLSGSAFNDLLDGNDDANRLDGGAGDDLLAGEDGDDRLDGGLGDDVLIGGAGRDTLIGGNGVDTASYSSEINGVTANLAAPELNTNGAVGDVYVSIENLTGSWNKDFLTGDGAANVLDGGMSGDTLVGGAGDDVLVGGEDGDVLNGGDGIDTASYNGWTAEPVQALLAAAAFNTGDAAGDSYVGIENLTGTLFDDTLGGDAAGNGLNGLDGDDKLYGNGGDDVLTGGSGGDQLVGGAGSDTAVYSGSVAFTTVIDLADFVKNTGEAKGDTFSSIENLTGGVGSDELYGDGVANVLTGDAGADILTGRDGADVLNGGAGADQLSGGAGVDTASYAGAAQGVTANLGAASLNAGDAAGDVYSSIENLSGTDFADKLTGNGSSNTIYGGDGADHLSGGLGVDVLTGGAGADMFFFDAKLGAANVDQITDFSVVKDTIELSHSIFGALATGTLAASNFVIGTAAADGNDHVIYDKASGALFYDADGAGGAAQVQFATLDHGLSLTNADFVVF